MAGSLAALLWISLFLVSTVIADKRQNCQQGYTCSSMKQIRKTIDLLKEQVNNLKCNCAPGPCGDDVIAYYPFDRSFRDVCHGYNGVKEGGVSLRMASGISQGAAFFSGNGKIRVARLNGYPWGSKFSVSLWFRRTASRTTYQGLINNGYYSHGSWEIRMGREQSGQMIGGGVITKHSSVTWDYVGLKATFDHWHHVVMTYNGKVLDFYLDNVKQKPKKPCCKGAILTKNTDVVIGQAGHGTSTEYFNGYIDEVKLFKKWLSLEDVEDLYQLKNI